MKNNKIQIRLFIYIILAIITVLLFSSRTSPLYSFLYSDYSGNEASHAMLVGKYWLQGSVPYKDLFLMAGPFYLLMQSMGWLIGKRYGILLLQIICFTFSLFMLEESFWNLSDASSKEAHSTQANVNTKKRTVLWGICTIITCIVYGALSCGGDSSIEWIILPISIGLWAEHRQNKQTSVILSVVEGLMVGVILLIDFRFGGILYIYVLSGLLSRKNGKEWLSTIIGLIIPLCIAFAYFSISGCFNDFMNATFLYPAQAMLTDMDQANLIHKCIKCLLLFPLFASGIYNITNKKKSGVTSVIATLFCGIIFLTCENNWYYYLSVIPAIPMSFSMLAENTTPAEKKPINSLVIISVVSIGLLAISAIPLKNYLQFIVAGPDLAYTQYYDELTDYLEQSNEASVIWSMDTDSTYYLMADYKPCTRYFADQTYLSKFNPAIEDECEKYLQGDIEDLLIITERGYKGRELPHYAMAEVFCKPGGSIFVYIPWTE